MTPGTRIIYTERPLDARKARVFKGTVIRVDPPVPEDAEGWGGWSEGIVVEYPKVKSRGQPCAVFHQMPHPCVREA